MTYPIDLAVTDLLTRHNLSLSFEQVKGVTDARFTHTLTGATESYPLGLPLPSPAYALWEVSTEVLRWCRIITQEEEDAILSELIPLLFGFPYHKENERDS